MLSDIILSWKKLDLEFERFFYIKAVLKYRVGGKRAFYILKEIV